MRARADFRERAELARQSLKSGVRDESSHLFVADKADVAVIGIQRTSDDPSIGRVWVWKGNEPRLVLDIMLIRGARLFPIAIAADGKSFAYRLCRHKDDEGEVLTQYI